MHTGKAGLQSKRSTAWGVVALACLGLSLWQRDRVLAQSSLLVFGYGRIPIVSWLRAQASESMTHAQQVGDLVACGISHPCTTFDRWQFIPIVDDEYQVTGGIRCFF